jgi:hypothetical protein
MIIANFVLCVLIILFLLYKERKNYLKDNIKLYPSFKTFQTLHFKLFRKEINKDITTGKRVVFQYDSKTKIIGRKYSQEIIVIDFFPIEWLLDKIRLVKQNDLFPFFRLSKYSSYDEYKNCMQ